MMYFRCAGVVHGSMPKERSAISCALRMRRLAKIESTTSPSIARYMRTIGTVETRLCTESCTWWLKADRVQLWLGLRRAPEAMVSFRAAQAALWGA